jgi:RimJ/RimL family protein N-acetyltransferase
MQAMRKSEFGQPIGEPVPGWTARALPTASRIDGRHCTLERLDAARHAADLHAAYSAAPDGRDWTYLFVGPFASTEDYARYAAEAARSSDPLHYAVLDHATGRAVGTMSLLRIDAANGVIEVGNITFSPALKGTVASTEAQFLFMRHVFDELGYRRYEWKCDSRNAPSRRAAERLGFSYEGLFRQAVMYKGRNRDTAWYSIIDAEWPRIRQAFETWLAPGNFDAQGRQLQSLAALRDAALARGA